MQEASQPWPERQCPGACSWSMDAKCSSKPTHCCRRWMLGRQSAQSHCSQSGRCRRRLPRQQQWRMRLAAWRTSAGRPTGGWMLHTSGLPAGQCLGNKQGCRGASRPRPRPGTAGSAPTAPGPPGHGPSREVWAGGTGPRWSCARWLRPAARGRRGRCCGPAGRMVGSRRQRGLWDDRSHCRPSVGSRWEGRRDGCLAGLCRQASSLAAPSVPLP